MMQILPTIALLLLFSTTLRAQTKTFTDSAIAQILHAESIKIGVKLFGAASTGKIKAYRTDSLDKTISAEEWKNLNWNASQVKGLSVQFITTSAIESDLQSMKLVGIAPLYNPLIQGIELPQIPMFFVSLADFDKIVTNEDKKLVQILAKLLFSTHNFHKDFRRSNNAERQQQDINTFISNTIYDNINRPRQHVYFTKENISLLSRAILNKTSAYFEKIIYYFPNSVPGHIYYYVIEEDKLKNVFEDPELRKPYNKASWLKNSGFCEIVSVQDPQNPQILLDTAVCTPYDFYIADKIFLSPSAIGMGTDFSEEFGGNKVRFYMQRKKFSAMLPGWLSFLLNTYLA